MVRHVLLISALTRHLHGTLGQDTEGADLINDLEESYSPDEPWRKCMASIHRMACDGTAATQRNFSAEEFDKAKGACGLCEHFYCILFSDSSMILIIVLFLIVIISAMADRSLEWLEKAAHRARHENGRLFEKIKSELLILGLLSFFLL
jgi:hypothetical protein